MKKLALLTALLLAGCGERTTSEGRVTVERVFMGQPGVYSFLYRDGAVLKIGGGETYTAFYNLYDDVPEDRAMWVDFRRYRYIGEDYSHYDIHIHHATDVNGTGWDLGKQGTGTTQVIR